MTVHWHRRLYVRLLGLYPRWFRARYASDMEADFVDLINRANQDGRATRSTILAWLIVARDLFVSLPREWLGSWRYASPFDNSTTTKKRGFVTGLVRDVRYALRSLLRNPGYVIVVVLTLVVGIGVNVAMFSVADAVLFSPLPYENADRLAVIWNRHPNTDADKVMISGPDLFDYRAQATSFEEMAFIHNATDNTLNDGARAEQVDVGYVSFNLFSFLGVDAVLGRTFQEDDENATAGGMGRPGPALISHALWARRYGGDPAVLGKTISVGGRPAEIIGVLPRDFKLILPYQEGGAMSSGANEQADVWSILPSRGMPTFPRSLAIVRLVGRLKEGVTIDQARDEMSTIAARLRAEHPVHAERGTEIDLIPLHADIVGAVRSTILSLFGAVAVVLLLACANVANLVSVRSAHRKNEVSICVALGAGRGRVMRQILVENAILALGGSILGILLAALLLDSIVSLAPPSVPMLDRVTVNGRAVLFATGAGALATVLFGVIPAFRTSGAAPSTQLRGSSSSRLGAGHRLRTVIVAGEIAMSLVLLIGGGLLVKSFLQLQRAQLGFEPASALTARVAIGHGAYDDDALRMQYWESLRRQMEDLPTVTRAGLVTQFPFGGMGAEIPYGSESQAEWGRYVAYIASASPGYFEAVGALVLEGRTFDAQDRLRDDVVVIDDIAARRLFPSEPAVGKQIWFPPVLEEERRPMEIIGVVQHIRHSNATGVEREVIYQQAISNWTLGLVARVAGDPSSIVPDLQRIAGALDPDIPVFDVRSLASYVTERNATTRFTMTLAALFGGVALVLAAVGLYGVIAYAVEQRTSEIGLRMALGASRARIVRLVLSQGGAIVGLGMAIGLMVALVVTRLLQSLLVEVTARDPVTFILVTMVLLTTALIATWVPAQRAARLDPLDTLRR